MTSLSPKSLLVLVTLALATLALAIGSGCDTADTDDGPRVLSGVWEGPITHPNPDFSGTLTLQITQTGNTLSGSATWVYPGERLSGSLSGGAPDEGLVAYTLDFGSRGTYFHTVDGSGDALSGTWESARGIEGTVSLRRQ
ncbi:MAG: hypothetical protein GVY18_14915 [Bacteroidetes bacterium]|jgi:hypothetical protein|nr:hypothetical protein [Bacteroidota bacterium]